MDIGRAYRGLMGRFATGVAIVAARRFDRVRAMTANSIASVSLDPIVLSVCIRNKSAMLELLAIGASFSVSVLSGSQVALSRYFSGARGGPEPDCWSAVYSEPVIKGALAAFLCKVTAASRIGDHTVVFGQVLSMVDSPTNNEALVYLAGEYHTLPVATAVVARAQVPPRPAKAPTLFESAGGAGGVR